MNRKAWGTTLLVLLLLPVLAACATQSGVRELDEATLEASVRAAIAEEIPNEATSIGVSVDRGRVTLTGSVESAEARTRIGNAVRGVNGVRSVVNNLTIR
jgi:osmotically-inducible protein OsmY